MITLVIIGALALLFLSAVLAPMESLGWWAGWDGKAPEKGQLVEEFREGNKVADALPEADFYLVYLSGIGAISGTSIPDEEYPFIHGLEQHLPGATIISDIYPYSVTNNGLTGQRGFASLWRWIEKLRLKNPASLVAMVVNMRNVFQLFVSADRRYGPIYNLGISNEIVRGLQRHGYRPDGGKPVVILGWSGGGQIAIGASTFLASMPGPIYVISVGGMLSDDPGLNVIDHLWHLFGTGDPLQALGGLMFSGRWPLLPQSPWNRAMADGKIDLIPLGPYTHNGKGNYFDMETRLPNDGLGRTYGEKTLDTITRILIEHSVFKPPLGQAAIVSESAPLPQGGTHVAQPMEMALTISSELYVRLADQAQQSGLDSIEQLLDAWERSEQERLLATAAAEASTADQPPDPQEVADAPATE